MMNPRVRRVALHAPIVLVLLAALAFQAGALYYRYMDLPGPLPPNVGNRPGAVSLLPPKAAGAMIRFGVVGDSRGAGAFETLMDDLKREHPDFIVLPGDMSYSASDTSHMLFQVEMESEIKPACPVFYIPGNHDVGPNYPLPLWESQYGPSQFFFKYGDNLFIFAYIVTQGENADQEQKGFDFLASTLAKQAPGAKRIFVFNHVPTPGMGKFPDMGLTHGQEVLDLLRKYHVDYFIASHYHGLAECELNGTRHIITGGGGARLDDAARNFYHALLFEVQPDGVNMKIIRLDQTDFLAEDQFERICRLNLWPVMAFLPPLTVLADAAIAVLLVLAVRKCVAG